MKFLRYSLLVLILVELNLVIQGTAQCQIGYKDELGICSGSNVDDSLKDLKIAQGLAILNPNSQTRQCVGVFSSYACAITYPKCTTDQASLQPLCTSTCTNVLSACASLTDPMVLKYIIGSPLFPTNTTCSSGNITATTTLKIQPDQCNSELQVKSASTCFAPLVEDTAYTIDKTKTLSTDYCLNGCCLPCPQSYFLYPSGYLERGFLATQIVRAISAVASFIMFISYLVLPGKRAHPSILILFASLAIFLYSSNVFFSLGNPQKIQCTSNVEPSTQENSATCGFQ
ncbi:10126_t:CDS:2, partial [Racocetra persica]